MFGNTPHVSRASAAAGIRTFSPQQSSPPTIHLSACLPSSLCRGGQLFINFSSSVISLLKICCGGVFFYIEKICQSDAGWFNYGETLLVQTGLAADLGGGNDLSPKFYTPQGIHESCQGRRSSENTLKLPPSSDWIKGLEGGLAHTSLKVINKNPMCHSELTGRHRS